MPEQNKENCQNPNCAIHSEPSIYDEMETFEKEIEPLVRQIEDICNAKQIPFVMGFQTTSNEESAGISCCFNSHKRRLAARMALTCLSLNAGITDAEAEQAFEASNDVISIVRAVKAMQSSQEKAVPFSGGLEGGKVH